jgi:hypothetical protein
MIILAFVAGLLVGALALVGAVVIYRAAHLRLRPDYPAQILARQIPSHVKEGRILINGTEVQFEGGDATVIGYRREPGCGNFYLLSSAPYYGRTSRWESDTHVWERDELRRAA